MKIVLILAILASVSTARASGISVYDGFETPSLSNLWIAAKFMPGAVEMQSKIVRAGKSAAKITLHEGDWVEADYQKSVRLERAELLESRELWAAEDQAYAYSFSMWIPQDFPIVPTRLVIAQWKQECPGEVCDPDSPVIAVRYSGGVLRITLQIGPKSSTLYRTEEELRNRWLDFKFEIRFSRSQTGRIKAWLNNEQVVDHKGVTAYPEKGGYPRRNHFYFKMGLYRDRMSEPMTIFIDEYRKVELADSGL
jgi:hypothetical protein